MVENSLLTYWFSYKYDKFFEVWIV